METAETPSVHPPCSIVSSSTITERQPPSPHWDTTAVGTCAGDPSPHGLPARTPLPRVAPVTAGFPRKYGVAETVPTTLLCPSCFHIFLDPVLLPACGHIVCRTCTHTRAVVWPAKPPPLPTALDSCLDLVERPVAETRAGSDSPHIAPGGMRSALEPACPLCAPRINTRGEEVDPESALALLQASLAALLVQCDTCNEFMLLGDFKQHHPDNCKSALVPCPIQHGDTQLVR